MRHTGRRAAGHAVPLRAAGGAAGRPARLAAAESRHDDPRFRDDQFQRQTDHDPVQRIRPAQRPAEGVFHLPVHEEKTDPHAAGAGYPDRPEGGSGFEPDLFAELRQKRRGQQRGESVYRPALRLFDGRPHRLAADVRLHDRRHDDGYGGQRLHPLLRRENRLDPAVRFDAAEKQTDRRREIFPERNLHR